MNKHTEKPDFRQSFRNIKAIVAWVISEGYQVRKTSIYESAKEAGFPLKGKDGSYDRAQVEKYAIETWANPSKAAEKREKKGIVPDIGNPKLRLQVAQAAEKEFKLDVLKGMYYLKSEEDQRDALVLYGIKSAMLNSGPFIVQDLIALVGAELGADSAAKVSQIIPELRERFNNSVLDMFDGIAKAGGVETPDVLP